MKKTVSSPALANKQLQILLAEGMQAEQQSVALFSRLETILAAIPDVVMEVDTDKIYTWANQAGFAFFGDDVIGKEAAFYLIGEQATYAAVQPQFDGRQDVVPVQSWQRRKDGEARLLAWQCRTIKNECGIVTGALSSARDITELSLADEKTEQFIKDLVDKNKELEKALVNVKQLTGLLPICASCKKIRDDTGYWQGVEMYIAKHSDARFSHGICPECVKKMYVELNILKEKSI